MAFKRGDFLLKEEILERRLINGLQTRRFFETEKSPGNPSQLGRSESSSCVNTLLKKLFKTLALSESFLVTPPSGVFKFGMVSLHFFF